MADTPKEAIDAGAEAYKRLIDDWALGKTNAGAEEIAAAILAAATSVLMARAWREGWYAAAYANQSQHENPYQERSDA